MQQKRMDSQTALVSFPRLRVSVMHFRWNCIVVILLGMQSRSTNNIFLSRQGERGELPGGYMIKALRLVAVAQHVAVEVSMTTQ